jgi:protocatechuate 3,4-dioxygenase beta subunit
MLGVGALLAPFVIQGQSVQVQSRDSVVSAMLQGSVRDSQGRPVAAASVYLRAEGGTQPLTAHTDSAGAFRFRSLRPWGERDEGG